ncbi:MAG: hypothetical protein Nk1A_3860 [Endomicrobiia bacterium]|nr:MAG: hypothetical protein Nk1A_3860 [Endomicrobiia bacterium]
MKNLLSIRIEMRETNKFIDLIEYGIDSDSKRRLKVERSIEYGIRYLLNDDGNPRLFARDEHRGDKSVRGDVEKMRGKSHHNTNQMIQIIKVEMTESPLTLDGTRLINKKEGDKGIYILLAELIVILDQRDDELLE